MAANCSDEKMIIWERSTKLGKWISYSSEVCKYLEENFKKKVPNVCLGNVDESLKIYSVNFRSRIQVSESTGTKLPIRRRLCDNLGSLGKGFTWQWLDDYGVFHSYEADVNDFIDTAFLEGRKSVSLLKKFGYPYEINFSQMIQVNKRSKRKRKVQRLENESSYPVEPEEAMDIDEQCILSDKKVPEILSPEYLAQEIPGTSDLLSQANAYKRNVEICNSNDIKMNDKKNEDSSKSMKFSEEETVGQDNLHLEQSPSEPPTTVALVNGRPWTAHRPPHTPSSQLKPVPGIEPLPKLDKPRKKIKRKRNKNAVVTCPEEVETLSVLERFTEVVDLPSHSNNEICIICCEPLSSGSSYNDDKTLSKLTLCSHIFHKACIEAMSISGSKEFLQCPSCKRIHGEKYGIQPPGEMIYHVLPYSLPGYPENDTIRIIYDIHSGTQGPEHPNPGKSYSARGFPRHCYLPDNEMGRKVLRLLIKAWKRRLIFTIGQSSTTSEENTVTWNEIHHKTEFGCNKFGHGYPDPNYFSNVLAELEAHGVTDDEVRVWTPV